MTSLVSKEVLMVKDNFQLPKMAGFLSAIRAELLNGKGFILFKDFPVQEWGNHKSAVAYMGLGTYLGRSTIQWPHLIDRPALLLPLSVYVFRKLIVRRVLYQSKW